MDTTVNPGYRKCDVIGRSVSIGCSEGDCRDHNTCNAVHCPLQTLFRDAPNGPRPGQVAVAMGFWWLGAANSA